MDRIGPAVAGAEAGASATKVAIEVSAVITAAECASEFEVSGAAKVAVRVEGPAMTRPYSD